MKVLVVTLFIVLVSSIFTGESISKEIFVTPQNIERAQNGSLQNPYTSVNAALEEIKEISNENIIIYLLPGKYYLDKEINLNELKNKNYKKITIRPYEKNSVLISGNKKISNWEQYEGDIYRAYVDVPNIEELFIDGKYVNKARYPKLKGKEKDGPYLTIKKIDKEQNSLIFEETLNIKNLQESDSIEFIIRPHWLFQIFKPDEIKKNKDGDITVKISEELAEEFFYKKESFYVNASFFIENSKAFISNENDWYFDKKTRYLYVKSEQKIHNKTIEIPRLETLLRLEGEGKKLIKNVEITGIEFQGTLWKRKTEKGITFTQLAQPVNKFLGKPYPNEDYPKAAIILQNTKNITLTKNSFSLLGATGIQIKKNSKQTEIANNWFHEIGANAIEIDSYSNKKDILDKSIDVIIKENTFNDIGKRISNSGAILAHYTNKLKIIGNNIYNLPYTAIQIGNQPNGYEYTGTFENIIKLNKISNVLEIHDDGGAIYTLGGKQFGTRIELNSINNVSRNKWAGNWNVVAIYLDNYTQYVAVVNNEICNSEIGGSFNYSKDNFMVNNGCSDELRKKIEAERND